MDHLSRSRGVHGLAVLRSLEKHTRDGSKLAKLVTSPARPIEAKVNKMTEQEAAEAIIADLDGRSSIDIGGFDDEIQDEIRDTIAGIVAAAIETKDAEIVRLKGVCEGWGNNYQSWVDANKKLSEAIETKDKRIAELEAVVALSATGEVGGPCSDWFHPLKHYSGLLRSDYCDGFVIQFENYAVGKPTGYFTSYKPSECYLSRDAAEAALATKETNSGPLGPNLPVNPVTYGPVNAAKEQETTVEEAVNNTADIDIVFCDTCGAPRIVIEHDGMPSWCKNHGPEAAKETADAPKS